jgi:hypothetical protein
MISIGSGAGNRAVLPVNRAAWIGPTVRGAEAFRFAWRAATPDRPRIAASAGVELAGVPATFREGRSANGPAAAKAPHAAAGPEAGRRLPVPTQEDTSC